MDHNRPLCDTPLDSGSQRASGNGTVPGAHPTTFCSPPAHRIQAQASSQPTIKWVATDSDTHSLEDEESGYGSTFPPSMTHSDLRTPAVGVHVAGPNSEISRTVMPPDGAGQDSYVDVYGRRVRSFHESNHTLHGILNGSADVHSTAHRFKNRTSASGGGSHESQLPAVGGHLISAPPLTRINYPEMVGEVVSSRMSHNTLKSSGPPIEAWCDHHNSHAEARPYHTEQRSESTPISAGPSEEKDRKAKQVMGPDKAVPAQNHAYLGKPDVFKTVGSPAIPIIIHDSRRVLLIPQTLYKCANLQDGWVKQAPIEFGRIKLIDAADQRYIGVHGYADKVLDYEGIGSSILCRLSFSRGVIWKWKILTKNNKRDREPITKAKLAYEVSKLVKRHIDRIRTETGYRDMAFENIILTRLLHVSKASWQPELWYEVPAPDAGPS